MSKEATTPSPKLFIGIDTHKRSWKIQTATDLSTGPHFTCPPTADHLKSWVDRYFPDYHVCVAYEAGCCGFEPMRSFLSFGWNGIVFNPADITRTGTASFQKIDRIDTRIICKELKDGRLKGITIPDHLQKPQLCEMPHQRL